MMKSTDKWNISDAAADYIFTGNQVIGFCIAGNIESDCLSRSTGNMRLIKTKYFPIFDADQYWMNAVEKSAIMNFVMIDCYCEGYPQHH